MNHFPKPLLVALSVAFGTAGSAAGASEEAFTPMPNYASPSESSHNGVLAPDYEEPVEPAYQDYIAEQTVTKHFLVVGTFRTYRGAAAAAARLVDPTGLRVESDNLEMVEGQPSYRREVCDLNGWDYPCYVPRGRFDDGSYLSVEPTDGYLGMRPGLFVVIAASGSREDVLAEQRELASRRVPAYVSRSEVWMGCIH